MENQKPTSSISQRMTPEEAIQHLMAIQANGTSISNSKQSAVPRWKKAIRFLIPTILVLTALIASTILYFDESYRGEEVNWYLILAPIILITLIVLFLIKRYPWAGFQKKTLWDWLQLLIIPVVLAVGGGIVSERHYLNDQQIAYNQQQEAILKTYLDSISDLVVSHNLRKSNASQEVKDVARAQTLVAIQRLYNGDEKNNMRMDNGDEKNNMRKGRLLQFLHETGLINKDNSVISLQSANLNDTDMGGARMNMGLAPPTNLDLHDDDLSALALNNAKLSYVNMANTILSCTGLYHTDLSGAILYWARP